MKKHEMEFFRELFRTEFHAVQRELAALVSELRYKQEAHNRIGMAVAVVESDLRSLIALVAGYALNKQEKARVISLVKAHARSSGRTGKVVPFPKKKRRKVKSTGPDAA